MTWSDDGLEYPCQKCGAFVPSRAKRCPRCGTEISTEEESVEAILEELTSLLKGDEGDEEGDEAASTEEGPTEEVPREMDTKPARADGDVKYKKVKRLPP